MNSQRVQLKLVLPVKWFMDGTNMNEWLCWSFCLLDLKANEGWCKGIFTFLLQVNSTSFTCKCNWLVIKTYEVNPVCFSPWILISLRGALSNAVHSNHIIELCSVCRCEQHTLQLSSAAILWAMMFIFCLAKGSWAAAEAVITKSKSLRCFTHSLCWQEQLQTSILSTDSA